MKDCRKCQKWETCPCGENGHCKGTSIGYSVGECKDYKENRMKSILVIEMPEEYVGSNIDVKLYGKNHTIHERYVNKLKPMPQKYRTDGDDIEEDSYWQGWNECIDAITGETDESNSNN